MSIASHASLTTGLQAYWEFNGNALDSHSGALHFPPNGESTYGPGKIGDGASFPATTPIGFSSTNAGLINTADFTWAGWFNLSASASQLLFWGGASLSVRRDATSWLAAGNFDSIYMVRAYTPGTWAFVVVRSSAANGVSIRVDDSAWATGPNDGTNAATGFWILGGTPSVASSVDAVGKWTRRLTDAEVDSLYNNGSGQPYPYSGIAVHPTLNTGLLNHWGFEDTLASNAGAVSRSFEVNAAHGSTPAEYSAGKSGKAVSAPGTTTGSQRGLLQFPTVGGYFASGAAWSLSLWFQLERTSVNNEPVFQTGGTGQVNILTQPDGRCELDVFGGHRYAGAVVPNVSWTHVVVTYAGTGINTTAYVNGVKSSVIGVVDNAPGSGGSINLNPQAKWDLVGYWTKQLTDAEAYALHNVGAGLPLTAVPLSAVITAGSANAGGNVVEAIDLLAPRRFSLDGPIIQTLVGAAPANVSQMFEGLMTLMGGPGTSTRDVYFPGDSFVVAVVPAQFSYDFSQLAVGVAPVGWTTAGSPGFDSAYFGADVVVEGVTSRALNFYDDNPLVQRFYYRDRMITGDVEVYMRLSIKRASIPMNPDVTLIIHGDGTPNNRYRLNDYNFDGYLGQEVYKYVGGATTYIAGQQGSYDGAGWKNMLFRIEGNVLKFKIWSDAAGEPAAWTTGTDAGAPYTSGLVGFEIPGRDVLPYFSFFGIGTGGLSAPRQPITSQVFVGNGTAFPAAIQVQGTTLRNVLGAHVKKATSVNQLWP